MKKIKANFCFCISQFLLLTSVVYSQGWVGNGSTNLNAYNSSLSSTPINVGIGTNAPTAQLHTTGSIRHENLTQSDKENRIVVVDPLGYLYWRDAATLGTQNAWLITGNGNTSGAVNFLGTTNNENLVFKTNNQQRVTILATNGFVGVGVTNPLVRLHVSNGLGSMGYPYESAVVENTGDTKFTVASSDPGGIGGSAIVLCHSNFTINNLYHGYEMQYANNGGRWLRFNYIQRNAAGTVVGGISNIMILNDAGRVGINLGPQGGGGTPVQPQANLHVSGTIRFENLPSGSGNILVVNNNGDVFRSNATAIPTSSYAEEISKLNKEISDLKIEMNNLKRMLYVNGNGNKSIKSTEQKAALFQNVPNPSNQSTTIKFSIPSFSKRSVLCITTIKGDKVKEIELKDKFVNSITLNTKDFGIGAYIYSLIVDGKIIDSKKMILFN